MNEMSVIFKKFIAINRRLSGQIFSRKALRSLRFLASRSAVVAVLVLLGPAGWGGAVCAQRPLPDFTARDPLAGVGADNWLRPAAAYDGRRFALAAGTGGALYAVASVGLYQTWYADFPRTGLHSYDDWGEWQQMDKAGHALTAYAFSRYAFAGLRWSGFERPAARYTALGVANLLQTTIEVMDGFSAEWGFSWYDMAFNLSGSLLFTAQDALWQEQRILMKVSSDLRGVPDVPVFNAAGAEGNLGVVSAERFGTGVLERFLKDYNAQTIWLSANPRAFFPRSNLPPWLNVAVGYGVESVYGAYGNVWSEGGQRFRFPEDRYRQWVLSPDVYFSRIPTRKRWVRLALGLLDVIKFPAPALEYSRGSFRAHWLY